MNTRPIPFSQLVSMTVEEAKNYPDQQLLSMCLRLVKPTSVSDQEKIQALKSALNIY